MKTTREANTVLAQALSLGGLPEFALAGCPDDVDMRLAGPLFRRILSQGVTDVDRVLALRLPPALLRDACAPDRRHGPAQILEAVLAALSMDDGDDEVLARWRSVCDRLLLLSKARRARRGGSERHRTALRALVDDEGVVEAARRVLAAAGDVLDERLLEVVLADGTPPSLALLEARIERVRSALEADPYSNHMHTPLPWARLAPVAHPDARPLIERRDRLWSVAIEGSANGVLARHLGLSTSLFIWRLDAQSSDRWVIVQSITRREQVSFTASCVEGTATSRATDRRVWSDEVGLGPCPVLELRSRVEHAVGTNKRKIEIGVLKGADRKRLAAWLATV